MTILPSEHLAGKSAVAAGGESNGSLTTNAAAHKTTAQEQLPPLRVLIGFSCGSASDELLRTLEPGLAATLGRRIMIDLMPGELGTLAAKEALNSPPDGNTILVATLGTHAINPNLNSKLEYDPIQDFAPICLATRSPLILGTRLSLGATSIQGLIELASRQTLSYGSSGVGSAPYLAGLLFQKLTGARLVHRAFPDTRKLYDALLDGSLDLSFNNVASMLPLVRQKRLRALALTSAQRCGALPGMLTLEEAGLDGYSLSNWLGFVAPIGTPEPVVATLNRGICAALEEQPTHSLLSADGVDVIASSSGEFSEYLKSELERWSFLKGQ